MDNERTRLQREIEQFTALLAIVMRDSHKDEWLVDLLRENIEIRHCNLAKLERSVRTH